MSDSSRPHGLQPTRPLHPWDFPGKSTGVGCHRLQQLYANKMDNLEEMDKFLEKYNFKKLNQEEIENLNRPIISTEIETVIKNLLANKAQVQTASQLNSTKNLEKS